MYLIEIMYNIKKIRDILNKIKKLKKTLLSYIYIILHSFIEIKILLHTKHENKLQ